jgi:hypothetical protein
MNRLWMSGVLAMFFVGCAGGDSDSDTGTVDSEETDEESDTETAEETDTGTDTGKDTDTDTGTDTGNPDPCANQGRFKCEGGATQCARVCGTVGTTFVQYYLDETELLHEFVCDTSAKPSRFLLGDSAGKKYVLLSLNQEQTGTFTVGGTKEGSQADFSQTGGVKDAWGTYAEVSKDDPTQKHGKGTGEIFQWQKVEDGGAVLGRVVVTEAWRKKDGFTTEAASRTGKVTIEFAGRCK